MSGLLPLGRLGRPGAGSRLRDPAVVRVVGAAALQLHQAIHGVKALEGVLAVEEPALVLAAEVSFDVRAGQRRPTENDRDVAAPPIIDLQQVVPHDQGALDEEAGHADDVRVFFGRPVQDVGQGNLDPEVGDLVAVVGEDDVDEVFSDVVHITADGCQHDMALATSAGLFHVWLEEGHGGLHGLGRLQHKRKLHLTRTE